MPRTREFDPREPLEKTMLFFLRKSYAETSKRDLIKYIGMAHVGLFAEFGAVKDAPLDCATVPWYRAYDIKASGLLLQSYIGTRSPH